MLESDNITVAILGCGPAGMFAAHAVAEAGYDFVIVSKARKSFMRGAQYLHQPIPGLSGDPFRVEYTLRGSVEGYKKKVYGDLTDILVSPSTLVGTSDAWDIREAYDAAWKLYQSKIMDIDLAGPAGQMVVDSLAQSYDLVISTVPANLLCHEPELHTFRSQKVWATEYVKTLGSFEHDSNQEVVDNRVVCSGDDNDWWYRQSIIHGWENTEFPYDKKPHAGRGKVHEVVKPIDTDCDCHPDVLRLGRYGQWKKGVLSHDAYNETVKAIVGLEQRGAEVTA